MILHLRCNFPLLTSPVASGAQGACGCEDGSNFCNYDYVTTGSCEPCSNYQTSTDCYSDGLPTVGADDCAMRCFGGNASTGTITTPLVALLLSLSHAPSLVPPNANILVPNTLAPF